MTTQAAKFPALLPTGSMESYISAAFQLPMLSAEEEHELAVRWRDHKDLEAARQLVLSHLRFVVRIARGYSGYGLPQNDLIQEGTLGLMKAVRRFDPDMGVRLVSFAVHWIKAEIHEYILRNWRIVKVATTKAQRKLFFNLRSAKKRLGWFTQEEIEGVAEDLGVKPETVIEMESRMSSHDLAFDPLAADEDDTAAFTPSAYLADLREEPSQRIEAEDTEAHQHQALMAALETLDERSRDILQRRWLNDQKETLHELAEEYGVSAERIRQIEKAAMKKLHPEIMRLRELYKDDPMQQQKAMMELYRKHQVSPMSGCLPMLVQIPIFFALYKVLFVTIDMRHQPFYGWIRDLSAPDPTNLFNLFGLIPWDPPSFLHIGVLPLLMGLTMWVQMKLNPPPPDPIQRRLFDLMPIFFTILLAPFPAGLVLYWTWNNILSIFQQYYIMKKHGAEIHLWQNLKESLPGLGRKT